MKVVLIYVDMTLFFEVAEGISPLQTRKVYYIWNRLKCDTITPDPSFGCYTSGVLIA